MSLIYYFFYCLNVQICFSPLDSDMNGYERFWYLGVKMVGVWARLGFRVS
jgi:hypothetical protein